VRNFRFVLSGVEHLVTVKLLMFLFFLKRQLLKKAS